MRWLDHSNADSFIAVGKCTVTGHARRTTRGCLDRGGAHGISTAVRHYPDIGYTVIILSNYSRAGDVALNHIEEILASF